MEPAVAAAYPIICMIQKCLLACPPSQSDCEELFSLLGKTGLEHLTSLAEIKARPNLAIFTEYQKWVDEQSDLVDTIMGMYQLDTSSHVEDEEKEERMSTWVNSLTI